MGRFRFASLLGVAPTVLFSLVLSAAPAEACLDAHYFSEQDGARTIKKAERALKRKRYQRVRHLLGDELRIENRRLQQRRLELLSIADIRTGHVRRGLRTLRYLLRDAPDDPYLLARLAEGLSKLEHGRASALLLLQDLEMKGFIDEKGRAILRGLQKTIRR